jgi:hypothetical protein
MPYGRNESRSFSFFPKNRDREIIKKKAKETMGTCFQNFKGTLYKNIILEDKEPKWDDDEYPPEEFLGGFQGVQAN